MKKVLLLGLGTKINKKEFNGYDIWTVNDFYSFHPDLKPARVFEIHECTNAEVDEISKKYGRYAGDWKRMFNESGAEIIVSLDKGLKRQKIFDWKKGFKDFGKAFFTGTFSNMMAMAMWEGYEFIELQGFCMLTRAEYEQQVKGLLRNIDVARSNGYEVYAPLESRWRQVSESIPEKRTQVYGLKKGGMYI